MESISFVRRADAHRDLVLPFQGKLKITCDIGLHKSFEKVKIQSIWLKAMKKSPAVSFYEKHGWKIIGETVLNHPEVIGDESKMYVMYKKLEQKF